MAIIIEMPKLSDTMSEGKILAWMKKEGELVEAGEVLAEIESDKASMEMEAYDTGYVRKLLVPAGGSAPVGAPIAIVTELEDEDISGALAEAGSAQKPAPQAAHAASPPAKPAPTKAEGGASAPARPAAATRAAVAVPQSGNGGSKVIASPLAYRMAVELGVDLRGLRGSGPSGRIVKRDVLAASASGTPATARVREASAATVAPVLPKPAPAAIVLKPAAIESVPPQTHEDVPLTSMRRIIGARLVESKNAAPHYYVTVEVDMKRAMEAREELNRLAGADVTYNDIVVKAVAAALGSHPELNASWQGEAIRYYKSVDIGVAVALPDGLLTPVVRACHLKSLGRISREVKDLVERAKQKKLTPDDYKGGTFTVSNLGMFGVKHFTAIINPPEACILAVSGIQEVPVVENGQVVPGHRMCLTLSSDHRVVDGARAASFLRDLRLILENPLALAL